MSGCSPCDSVFAVGVPDNIDDDAIKAAFGEYGEVVWCKVMKGKGKKAAALVQFSSVAEATHLVESAVDGVMLSDWAEPIAVSYKSEARKKGGDNVDKGKGKGTQERWTPLPLALGKAPAQPAGKLLRPSPYPQSTESPTPWGKAESGTPSWGKGSGKASKGGHEDGGILALKKELQASGKLPGGKWSNDDDGALFFGALPSDTTDKDLYEICSPFGAIPSRGLKVMGNGTAFVNFVDANSAQEAIAALDGTPLQNGKFLRVKLKTPKPTQT